MYNVLGMIECYLEIPYIFFILLLIVHITSHHLTASREQPLVSWVLYCSEVWIQCTYLSYLSVAAEVPNTNLCSFLLLVLWHACMGCIDGAVFNTSWVEEHAREDAKATPAAGGVTKVCGWLPAQTYRRQHFFTKADEHQKFTSSPAELQDSDVTSAEQQTNQSKSEQQETPESSYSVFFTPILSNRTDGESTEQAEDCTSTQSR